MFLATKFSLAGANFSIFKEIRPVKKVRIEAGGKVSYSFWNLSFLWYVTYLLVKLLVLKCTQGRRGLCTLLVFM